MAPSTDLMASKKMWVMGCLFSTKLFPESLIWQPEPAWNALPRMRLFIIPPATKLGGVYWIHPVCLSVRLSVCLSVCSLTFRVRPVASTVQDGFSPYLVQMINSKRGCVACDDLWPWPISSRSFGLELENRVRSVASTVLDGFFFYIAQIITIIRGCVACYDFFRIWKFEFLANFWNFSTLTLKKKIYNSRWILSIFSTDDH